MDAAQIVLNFALLPALIVVPLLLMWASRGRRRAGCGCCGADVTAVKTFTCPGCRADLRHVGIATARFRHAAGPRGYLLAWTGFYLLPAILLTMAAIEFGLVIDVMRMSSRTDYDSQRFEHVDMQVELTRSFWKPQTRFFGGFGPSFEYDEFTARLVFVPRGDDARQKVVTLAVTWPQGTSRVIGPEGRIRESTFTPRRAMREVYDALGLDQGSDVAENAMVLGTILREIRSPAQLEKHWEGELLELKYLTETQVQRSTAKHLSAGWMTGVLAVLLITWLVVAVLLVWWRRRAMARVESTLAAMPAAAEGTECP